MFCEQKIALHVQQMEFVESEENQRLFEISKPGKEDRGNSQAQAREAMCKAKNQWIKKWGEQIDFFKKE